MSDKMREEFEVWASRHHGVLAIGSVNGHYSNAAVNHDWFVWQKSREYQVVELPPIHEDAVKGFDHIEIMYALSQAGIKWTE